MFIARVTGSVVSTQKVDSMTGHKLLVVEPIVWKAQKGNPWSQRVELSLR